jgi:glycosyltransferase involved in cell wall biosynthesis
MHKKNILYLSTNEIWGGSEILWTQSAKALNKKGYTITAGVKYNYELIKEFIPHKQQYINLQNHFSHPYIILRIVQKLRLGKFPPKNILHKYLKQIQPDLVIISQGNNIEGKQFMMDCIACNIPFVTLTHLVTPDFWPGLNDETINELRQLYTSAKCNYFVSHNTLLLHEKLLGEKLINSAIVYNPFIKNLPVDILFPSTENNIYKVALIGRIENFHKGYDLLIDVIKNEKWQQRPIHFSLFGKGPHVQLLKRMIDQNDIANFTIHNHEENIAAIWQSHHILLMPSRMEGQSLTLIEAMHFKRAAIVTNVGGTKELIDEGVNGFMAAYPTAEDIDAAMERAWAKREDWENLGINAGKAIAEKHPADALDFFNRKIEMLLAG